MQVAWPAADKAASPRSAASPSAARPGCPDTHRSSPGRPPARVIAAPCGTSPSRVTDSVSGPRVVSPPARSMSCAPAQAKKPRAKAAIQASSATGSASARKAQRGRAPIAARSETLTASVFQPRSSGSVSAKKWVPATSMSVVTASCEPGWARSSAASSPTARSVWRGARVKWRRIRSNSEGIARCGAGSGGRSGDGRLAYRTRGSARIVHARVAGRSRRAAPRRMAAGWPAKVLAPVCIRGQARSHKEPARSGSGCTIRGQAPPAKPA